MVNKRRDGNPQIPKQESSEVEFQLSAGDVDSLASTVCAFLNTNGGRIWVGVSDDGHIVGVKDGEALAKKLRIALQDKVTPKSLWSVHTESIDQKEVVVVEAPPGEERPYVCSGAIYRRVKAKTIAADASYIHRMIETRYRTRSRWERETSPGIDIKDLDIQELKRTKSEIREVGRYRLEVDSDNESFLSSLGLMQSGVLTNASALLFANDVGLYFPQSRIRATVFESSKTGRILDDRQLDGHAFELLKSSMKFLEAHVKVISEVTSSSLERKTAPEYPMVALREGIMNAIAHRDYAGFDSGMAISVYPERIEIWNSGRLPEGWTPSRLSRPHPSMPRNPDLCQILFLRGLVERIGSGTLRILDVCRSSKLPTPQWTSDITGVTLTLFNGKPLSFISLNQRQLDLLVTLEPGQELKPRDYYRQKGDKVSQRHLQRDLSELLSGGWLRQRGKGPSTTYIRTDAPKP